MKQLLRRQSICGWSLRPALLSAIAAASLGLAAAIGGGAGPASGPPGVKDEASGVPTIRRLADAARIERQIIGRLVGGESWARRALAALRLERYGCDESRLILQRLLADSSWQVRAFTLRTMGRRHLPIDEQRFDAEEHPLVLRAALRHRYPLDTERLGRGIRFLARSRRLEDKMLAAELGSASGDQALRELATATVKKIILRMSRIEGGMLSPRLAALTGQPDMRRHYRWRTWLREAGRHYAIQPAYRVSPAGDDPPEPGLLARLEPEQFAALESYIEDLSHRSIDLAICLDCTASMSGELAQAQGGIDDLMVFAGDVADDLRVAVVAYRDRRDEFETRTQDFTSEIAVARAQLWSLGAAGGGDTPEAVYPALRLAYSRLSWRPDATSTLVLVGDAPPHVGYGSICVQMARRAHDAGLTTHVIQADGRPVKHFPEIAAAGGGRCVTLGDAQADSLIVQIVGLTLGERFGAELTEFFRVYLDLCR